MTTLDTLPTEVLLEIIANMRRMRDLSALSKQCRRIHQVVDMPNFRRFHRIRLRSRITMDESEVVFDLARQILRNPKLGWYVRQLEVYEPPGSDYSPEEMETEKEDEDAELIRHAIDTAGFGEHKDLLFQTFVTESGNFRSVLAILFMTMCPNIDSLRICETQFPLKDFLKKNNSTDAQPQFLQRLQDVKVLHNDLDDPRFYNVSDPMPMIKLFHRLPSIRRFSISATTIDAENGMYKLAPKTSNFSSIHLDHCAIEGSDLATMIRNCKALEELKYTAGGRAATDTSDVSIVPKTVGLALRQHKSTLSNLDLDIDDVISFIDGFDSNDEPNIPDESDGDDEDRVDSELGDIDDDADGTKDDPSGANGEPEKFGRTIGSLREFTSLKRLSIGIKLLLGSDLEDYPPPLRLIDILPPNLEYLRIRGYEAGEDETETEMVKEFMEQKEEKFPQLQVVEGVENCIPTTVNVDSPDDNYKLLFPESGENDWAEPGEFDDLVDPDDEDENE